MPRLIARIDLKLTKPGMNDVLYVGGRGARRSAQSTRFGPGRAHPRRCSRRELWSWPIRNRRCRSGGFFFQNLRAPFSFCSSLMFEPKNRPVEKKNKREKIENFGTVWSFFSEKKKRRNFVSGGGTRRTRAASGRPRRFRPIESGHWLGRVRKRQPARLHGASASHREKT